MNKLSSYYAQKEDGWCGPAALGYAMAKIGVRVSQENIVNQTRTTNEEGVETDALEKGARSFGFKTAVIQGKLARETLDSIKRALKADKSVVIDFLDGKNIKEDGHYSVVEDVTDKNIKIWNPSGGKIQSLLTKDFIKRWRDEHTNGEVFHNWAMILSK